MNGIHGKLLFGTGLIHMVFGLLPVTYLPDWHHFFTSGLWDTVSIESDRSMAAFWFVIAGPLFMFAGLALYYLEVSTKLLPIALGILMLAIVVLGAVMSPTSGFTFLLLPQSIFYVIRSSR